MHTASLPPLTILLQICTVRCTKLRKHFHAIVEVFYCFTVAIDLPGDASCIKLQWRQKVGSCSAHAKQGGYRVRQQWELGVRFLGRTEAAVRKYKWCNVRCFTATYKNKKFQHSAFLLSTLAFHLTKLNKVIQAVCFDFAQVKASAEQCINKFSDAAAKSDLKANCEKFGSELRELGKLDGLADSCVSNGMAFSKGAERLAKLIVLIQKNEEFNYRGISLLSLPGRVYAKMPRK